MKTAVRITLFFSAVFIVLAVLPFLLPLPPDGADPATLADPEGRFVEVEGFEIYMLESGSVDAPVVIFLHGLFGSTFSWRENLEAVADAGYRAIALDRPGAGLSDKRESLNYSHPTQADVVAALMDDMAIDEAVIVGHSAGGNVLAQFAARHPERARALVIVDGAILAGGPPPFVGSIVALPSVWRWGRIGLNAFLTRDRLEQSLNDFQGDPSFLTEADYDGYWRAFEADGWDVGLLATTRDGGPNRVTEDQIRAFDMPTLILWGGIDTVTPLADGEQLDELIPNSELIVYSGVGHQPMEEAPEVFNEDLISFLNQLDS